MLELFRGGMLLIFLSLDLSMTLVHASELEQSDSTSTFTLTQSQPVTESQTKIEENEPLNWITFYGAVVFLLSTAMVALYIVKRRTNLGGLQGPIKVLHAVPIGQRQRLVVISYKNQEYLLAQTTTAISVIGNPAESK